MAVRAIHFVFRRAVARATAAAPANAAARADRWPDRRRTRICPPDSSPAFSPRCVRAPRAHPDSAHAAMPAVRAKFAPSGFNEARAPRFERMPPAERFVKNNSQRKNVGAFIRLFFPAATPETCTQTCLRISRFPRIPASSRPRTATCAPARNSRTFSSPASGQHQVFGLDVAMLHTAFVRCRQRGGALLRDGQKFGDGERLLQAPPQRLPFDVLHHQKNIVAQFEYVEDRRDVRIVQPRRALGFLPQTLAVVFGCCESPARSV